MLQIINLIQPRQVRQFPSGQRTLRPSDAKKFPAIEHHSIDIQLRQDPIKTTDSRKLLDQGIHSVAAAASQNWDATVEEEVKNICTTKTKGFFHDDQRERWKCSHDRTLKKLSPFSSHAWWEGALSTSDILPLPESNSFQYDVESVFHIFHPGNIFCNFFRQPFVFPALTVPVSITTPLFIPTISEASK